MNGFKVTYPTAIEEHQYSKNTNNKNRQIRIRTTGFSSSHSIYLAQTGQQTAKNIFIRTHTAYFCYIFSQFQFQFQLFYFYICFCLFSSPIYQRVVLRTHHTPLDNIYLLTGLISSAFARKCTIFIWSRSDLFK